MSNHLFFDRLHQSSQDGFMNLGAPFFQGRNQTIDCQPFFWHRNNQAQIQRDLAHGSLLSCGCGTYKLGEIRFYLQELFQRTKPKTIRKGGEAMKRKTMVVVGVFCLTVMLGFMTICEAQQTLNMAVYQGSTHELSIWNYELAPTLQKMSNNRVQLKIHDSGTIAKANGMFDAVQRNMADIGFVYPSVLSSTIPVLELAGGIPFILRDNYEWWKALPAITAVVQEAIEAKGYNNVLICSVPYYGGWYKLATKKKVTTPKDLKGLKIKSIGTGMRDYISNVGGSPTSIDTAEVYEAASRNLIQGTIGTHTHWTGWNMREVFGYLIQVPITPTTMYFLINKNTLKKLGPDLAAIFVGYCEFALTQLSMHSLVSEEKNEDTAHAKMEFVRPTKEQLESWYAPSNAIVDAWVKRSAPYGQRIMDIIKKVRQSDKKGFVNY
jgi:TRAP-type C4-dicarboxylate transport system substrate-binding protein